MKMKFSTSFAFLLILPIFFISNVYGEMEPDSTKMEHDPAKDFAGLLKEENISKFFTNQRSGDFFESFEEQKIQEPSDNNILIKSGTTIQLEGSPSREYSTILVEGNLRIIDTDDSSLRVQKIIVGPTGSLIIGDEQNPIKYDKRVEIVFVKNKEGELGIFVFGKLEIFGNKVEPTFVGLENFAKLGEKRLVVNEELENWKNDDIVVVTSPGDNKCNEVAQISKVVSPYVFLKNPLTCSHRVISDDNNSIVSHVALLSRNVRISSEDSTERGSVNFFHGSTGYIKFAQFDQLGPKEVLGRYPIHFHHLKDSSRGMEVVGNSITNSENRWITIHDSNGILVKNNVGYISQGHGFFLEDGNEFDNVFEKNIGIITRDELILNGASSVFWTQNPMNVYRDNVAVSGQYWGFFFDIPNREVDMPNSDIQYNLRSLPSLEFKNNLAYNNLHGGIKIIRPTIEEEIHSSEIIISNFRAMGTVVKSENHFGVIISGSDITISNAFLLNHKFGIKIGGENNKIIDTKIKMESNFNPDSDISGILIAGTNNWIENSEIKGYVSKNNNDASDISVYNNEKQKRLLSAKIINTTLLDPKPFYFGNPGNEKSFLEIYGYNAPFALSKKLPENFMLKKIGSDTIEERGEYNNLEFDAMIKMLPNTKPENQLNANEEVQRDNFEKTKSELIKRLKIKALDWGKNKFTDKEFLDEIEILFESRVLEIRGVEQTSFQEFQFIIPQWVKKLISFWSENSISDQEFFNALEYVLELQLSIISDSYTYEN